MTGNHATRSNTVFVTPTTYRASKMEMLISSARKNDVFLDVVEEPKWHNHYYNKILQVGEHLKFRRDQGYEYAFVMDARDVAIAGRVDMICRRLNDTLIPETILFNPDFMGKVFPYDVQWYRDLYIRMAGQDGILNSGLFAGRIVDLLWMIETATAIREELRSGHCTYRICQLVYEARKAQYANDDQLLYQLVSIIHPRRIRVDRKKQLLACVNVCRQDYDLSDRGNNTHPPRHSVGEALIIHMPGGCTDSTFISRHNLNEAAPPFDECRTRFRSCRHATVTDRKPFDGRRANKGCEVECRCEERIPSDNTYLPIYESYCRSGLCVHYRSY